MNFGLSSQGEKALRTKSERAGDDVRRWRRFWAKRKEFIGSCAEASRLWLKKNSESFTADGNRQPQPWWPAPMIDWADISSEKDEIKRGKKRKVFLRLLQERDALVRDRCFEHGLLDMLWRLGENPDLKDDNWHKKITRIATNSEVTAILRELYRLRLKESIAGGLGRIGLIRAAELMKYSPGVGTDKVYRRIAGLAEWGLVGAMRSQDSEVRWNVSIGPAGWAFLQTAFYPTVDEISVEIGDLRREVE